MSATSYSNSRTTAPILCARGALRVRPGTRRAGSGEGLARPTSNLSGFFREGTVRERWSTFPKLLSGLSFCTVAYVAFLMLAVGDDTACDSWRRSLPPAHSFSRAFCARSDALVVVRLNPLCLSCGATCGRNGHADRLIQDWILSIRASRFSLFIDICSPAGNDRRWRKIRNRTLGMIAENNSEMADVLPFSRDVPVFVQNRPEQNLEDDHGGQGIPQNLVQADNSDDDEIGGGDDDAGRNRDGRVMVEVTPDEMVVNDHVIDVLADHDGIYQRGRKLVHIIHEKTPKAAIRRGFDGPFIAPVPKVVLREMLTSRIRFTQRKGKTDSPKIEHIHPPKWCVDAVAERGQWPGIRHLAGVVTSPVLRVQDGSTATQQAGIRR